MISMMKKIGKGKERREFEAVMEKYERDPRVREIYSDPVVRTEMFGSFQDAKKLSPKKFMADYKTRLRFGGNHIEQMMEHIRKGDRILELAGASGWPSAMLRQKGFKNLLLTDINPFDLSGMGAIKRLCSEPIKTRIMRFEKIDLPKDSFDVVFMVSSLHHSSDVPKVAAQVRRVLRKGGKWFIIGEPVRGILDPNNKDMMHSVDMGFNDHFYYFRHYKKSIAKVGFRMEVLFPRELHKILTGEIKYRSNFWHKRILLGIAKAVYRSSPGKRLIQKTYPLSLYFIGSHSIMMCTKE